jgi:tripartite-type tricarboxylate transporter receptor subunit TctC
MQRNAVALAVALTVALASVFAICDISVQAQTWPSKPIRIILPNPPGGTNDILARMLQVPLQEILGQPVVVENRSGGSNIPATEAIVRSPPDGYTIGTIISVHASNVALQPKLPYDSIKDITPIAFLGHVGNIVVVHPAVKASSMQELIALAKANPGNVHHGSSGSGTSQHFSGELLKLGTGAEIVHVPYRGGGPAINDLLGGHIQMMFGNFTSIVPHVRSGAVRPLAVTAGSRSPVFPDLPTVAEAASLPGFAVTEWYAVIGPPELPPDIVGKLNAAFYEALKRPDIASRLRDQGIEVDFMTPARLGEFVKAEIAKLGDIAKRANMRLSE